MAGHPSKDELSGFILGKLPLEVSDAVADHLEQCPPCQETIHDLEAHKDTLLQDLRQPPPPSPESDPECRRAVERARAVISSNPAPAKSSSASPPSVSIAAGAAVPSREQFLTALKSSAILDAEHWANLEQQPAVAQATDGAALARALVECGALTKFQATLLYQNKPKGLLFGEYVVLDLLGAGGMGQVFKARHRRMDRIVALKVLAKAAVNSPDAVKRFQREVKAAAKLIHPNIVIAHDAGQQDGVHYLVMEYVPGSDLSALVKREGPLPVDKAISYITQAARGLAFAHDEGVVHRDIKPGNLLVDQKGIVRILDMGLARLDGDAASKAAGEGLTQTGQVMGTVDYMAPEQAFDTSTADANADMYSLGCTLYRILTGQNMFSGDTLVQKILAHREHPIPSLAAARQNVPPQLDAIYQRMVAKQPADRPTMAELVVELETLAKGEPTAQFTADSKLSAFLETKRNPSERADLPNPLAATRNDSIRNKPPSRKLIAAGAAGFLLACLGVWVIIHDKDGNETARMQVPSGGAVTMAENPPPSSNAATAPTVEPPAAVVPGTDSDVVLLGGRFIADWKWSDSWTSVPKLAGLKVENRGNRGRTVGGIALDVDELVRSRARPRIVLLHFGINGMKDVHNGSQAMDHFTKAIERLRSRLPLAKIIVTSVVPDVKSNSEAAALRRLNGVLESQADQKSTYYFDLNALLFDASGRPRPELFADDQITAAGYRRWAESLAPLLTKLLAPAAKSWDLVLLGNTFIERWTTGGKSAWNNSWKSWNVSNLGVANNSINDVVADLERLRADNSSARVFMVQAGGSGIEAPATLAKTGAQYKILVGRFKELFPDSHLLLTSAIFQPTDRVTLEANRKLNDELRALADGENIHFLDLNAIYFDAAGNERVDLIHGHTISERGYDCWAEAMLPLLTKLLPQAVAGSTGVSTGTPSQPVNMLLLASPSTDYKAGTWTKENGELVGVPAILGKSTSNLFDYAAPDEYDYRVELTRERGDDGVELGLGANGTLFAVSFDSAQGTKSALLNVDGKGLYLPQPVPLFETGKKHELRIAVRRDSITAVVDGKEILRFDGTHDRLTRAEKRGIFYFSTASVVRFHSCKLTPIVSLTPQPQAAPPIAIAPFDAAQAGSHQEAWAKHLGVPVEFTNSAGITFRLVPPGKLSWTNVPADPLPAGVLRPSPSAEVKNAFYLAVTEVTRRQYHRFNPTKIAAPTTEEALPIASIDWFDALRYCNALSEAEGLERNYDVDGASVQYRTGNGYRVPTSSEWAYAAAAGDTRAWREERLTSEAWLRDDGEQPRVVATKQANAFGFFDMVGNVQEFGSGRGAWMGYGYRSPRKAVDLTLRPAADSRTRAPDIGFRLALSIPVDAKWQPPMKAVVTIPTAPPIDSHDTTENKPSSPPPPAVAPFDAAQAKAHQEAWAKYLGVPREFTNSIGMQFTLIPPGEFLMGSPESEADRLPEEFQHHVRLSKPFYLGTYEVTQAELAQLNPRHKFKFAREGGPTTSPVGVDTDRFPAEGLNEKDTRAFLSQLSNRLEERQVFRSYRLPTEAEWEFACRAGTSTPFSFTGAVDDSLVRCSARAPQAVGKFPPNPFGLFDMHGNIAELCSDRYSDRYFAESPKVDPVGPAESSLSVPAAVVRGGSFANTIQGCRAAFRQASGQGKTTLGFRVACDVPAPALMGKVSPTSASATLSNEHATPVASPPPPVAVAPFDTAQARAHQEAWAKHLGVPVETTNSVGMKLALIPAGEFLMGSSTEDVAKARRYETEWGLAADPRLEDELPQHREYIKKPLLVAATEVTVGQFKRFTADSGYITEAERNSTLQKNVGKPVTWKSPLYEVVDNYPVNVVTWNDAVAFCNWLTLRENKQPCYHADAQGDWLIDDAADGYRLPTEAEWEYACRAGTTTQYSFGDDAAKQSAEPWFNKKTPDHVREVAVLPPNAFGLYDLHGNVREWCQDAFGRYSTTSVRPSATEIRQRVVRGGAWNGNAVQGRSAYRFKHGPGQQDRSFGFRVVRTLPTPAVRPADSIDLLKNFTPNGSWEIDRGALHAQLTGKWQSSLMPLSLRFPAEFDWHAVVERVEGNGDVQFGIVTEKSQFVVFLNSTDPRGPVIIGPKSVTPFESLSKKPALTNGARRDIVIRVRTGSVEVVVDQEVVARYSGPLEELGPAANEAGMSSSFLRVYNRTTFHLLEVLPP